MVEYIDEFEKMEAESEQGEHKSCYTCKNRDTPMLKEPCKTCWNRGKWKERNEGEK